MLDGCTKICCIAFVTLNKFFCKVFALSDFAFKIAYKITIDCAKNESLSKTIKVCNTMSPKQ